MSAESVLDQTAGELAAKYYDDNINEVVAEIHKVRGKAVTAALVLGIYIHLLKYDPDYAASFQATVIRKAVGE